VLLGGAPSLRLGAGGLLPAPPPPAECSWRSAAPGRAGWGLAPARRGGGGGRGLGGPGRTRCCWSAAARMRRRARSGPGLPRGRAHARRAIVMQLRAAVCGEPELGHGPGHGPGSAQCARGCYCVLHGSSASKSMTPRNEATAGCAQNVRSSFAAGP
jgi:hypothetical protein